MKKIKIENIVFIALIFLLLGVFISVSLFPLFHLFIIFSSFCLIYNKDVHYNLSLSNKILIVIIIWGIISSFLNLDELFKIKKSILKDKYAFIGLLSIYSLIYYQAKAKISHNKKLLTTFMVTIIASAIYGVIYSRYDFNLLTLQREVTLQNRNGGFTGVMRYGYGMSFVLTLFFGVLLNFEKYKPYIYKKLFFTTLLIGSVGFILSFVRGGLLGFLASIPFLFFYKSKKIFISLFLLSISTILSLGVISYQGGDSSSRFFKNFASSTNLKRFSVWEAAMYAVKEKPIIGHGNRAFGQQCHRLKKQYNIVWYEYCSKYSLKCDYKKVTQKFFCGHAHNIYLNRAANNGVVGLVLLVLWLLVWLFEMYKLNTFESGLFIAFIVNMTVSGLFEVTFDANNSSLIFLVYAVSQILYFKSKQSKTLEA